MITSAGASGIRQTALSRAEAAENAEENCNRETARTLVSHGGNGGNGERQTELPLTAPSA